MDLQLHTPYMSKKAYNCIVREFSPVGMWMLSLHKGSFYSHILLVSKYHLYVRFYRKNRETEIYEIESQIASLGDEFTTTTNFLTEFEAARNLKRNAAIRTV